MAALEPAGGAAEECQCHPTSAMAMLELTSHDAEEHPPEIAVTPRAASLPAQSRGASDAAEEPGYVGVIEWPESSDRSESKPRLLALHGWRSNSRVAQRQVANLGLDRSFDVVYLEGCIKSETASDEVVASLFEGPFFSWVDRPEWEPGMSARQLDERDGPALVDALRFLASEIRRLGPFDVVFGFSQGACVAGLLCHPDVLRALSSGSNCERLVDRAIFACAGHFAYLPCALRELSVRSSSPGSNSLAGSSRALLPSPQSTSAIRVPTLHLIGLEDPVKAQGEQWVQIFHPDDRLNLYFKGGHEVPSSALRDVRADLHAFLAGGRTSWMGGPASMEGTSAAGHVAPDEPPTPCSHQTPGAVVLPQLCSPQARRRTATKGEGDAASQGSADAMPLSRALLAVHFARRVAHSADTLLAFDPEALSIIEARGTGPDMFVTFQDALGLQSQNEPIFHDVDVTKAPITYGALLDFLIGAGDLRSHGVPDSTAVVGYPCPPGVAGAVALLTVAAQCTAVPFDPRAAEGEVLETVRQLNISHFLFFEGVDTPNFQFAVEAAGVDAIFVRLDPDAAGTWLPPVKSTIVSGPGLCNPTSGSGMLLRTSGSTGRPKVVPLKVGQLLQNGRSLGASLGISAADTCLSVMPLFHIGGVSNSIMAVATTGGATLFAPPFKPHEFLELLAHPAGPTWYTAVPSMHMAAYSHAREFNGGRPPQNRLRFIRSGASALSHEDAVLLRDFWGLPVLPTYAMSEQAPICQPCQGYQLQFPGAVGQPVVASICLVNAETLKPVPFGEEGEVCVSGRSVMEGYADDPEANSKAFFVLGRCVFMRTGDMGRLNSEGYLTLTGRIKELIKRGGEQVSPAEVEAVLDNHPAVKKAVCFAVPSALWGEVVGCALVLHNGPPRSVALERELLSGLRELCRSNGLAAHKVPVHFRCVEEGRLPMTATKKYIRIGLAEVLGVSDSVAPQQPERPVRVSDAITGLRFVLAMGVLFNHYGAKVIDLEQNGFGDPSTSSLGAASNMRSDWPVSVFFITAGFSLALSTTSGIDSPMEFYKYKLATLHPTYLLIMLVCLVNLVVVCRPSTYDTNFSWTEGPAEGKACSATLAGMPWSLTLVSTVLIYSLQLQAWFFVLPISWYLMFYVWFSSVYYFLLLLFPLFWNWVFPKRGNERSLWALLAVAVCSSWVRSALLGLHFSGSGLWASFGISNGWAVGAYMFPPSFVPYFFGGALVGLLFRLRRPDQGHDQRRNGRIADALSLVLLLPPVLSVSGAFVFGTGNVGGGFIPAFVRSTDESVDALSMRIWSALLTSIYVPIALPWLYHLSVGRGIAARLLSQRLLVSRLAPTAYHTYLLQQPVGQLYWWITRSDAGPWSWWSFRKPMYWFSPYSLPVPWFEFLLLVIINVSVATLLVRYVDVWGMQAFLKGWGRIFGHGRSNDIVPEDCVLGVLRDLTGAEISPTAVLAEAGLASVGVPVLAAALNTACPSLHLTVAEVAGCETVSDLTLLVAKGLAAV